LGHFGTTVGKCSNKDVLLLVEGHIVSKLIENQFRKTVKS